MLAAKASRRRPADARSASIPTAAPITVRAGRFGAYVNWGKVNATIPKSTPPEVDHARRSARTPRRARGTAGAQGQGAGKEARRQGQETRRAAEGRRQDGAGEQDRDQESAGQVDASQESGGEKGGGEEQAQRLRRTFSPVVKSEVWFALSDGRSRRIRTFPGRARATGVGL